MICKRCRGLKRLFRPRHIDPDGKTIVRRLKDSFRDCTDCGGSGTKPANRKQETIHIHALNTQPPKR